MHIIFENNEIDQNLTDLHINLRVMIIFYFFDYNYFRI